MSCFDIAGAPIPPNSRYGMLYFIGHMNRGGPLRGPAPASVVLVVLFDLFRSGVSGILILDFLSNFSHS